MVRNKGQLSGVFPKEKLKRIKESFEAKKERPIVQMISKNFKKNSKSSEDFFLFSQLPQLLLGEERFRPFLRHLFLVFGVNSYWLELSQSKNNEEKLKEAFGFFEIFLSRESFQEKATEKSKMLERQLREKRMNVSLRMLGFIVTMLLKMEIKEENGKIEMNIRGVGQVIEFSEKFGRAFGVEKRKSMMVLLDCFFFGFLKPSFSKQKVIPRELNGVCEAIIARIKGHDEAMGSSDATLIKMEDRVFLGTKLLVAALNLIESLPWIAESTEQMKMTLPGFFLAYPLM